MAVATQIKAAVDRMAKGRQNSLANYATGSTFWTLADAAQDQTYENQVKGTLLAALDAALAAGSVWSLDSLRQWFALHWTYFQTDLALGATPLDAYQALVGWRIPFQANEACYEALTQRWAAQYVFAKGTRVAALSDPSTGGMHLFGTWTGASTWAIVDGPIPSTVKGAIIMIVSRELTPNPTSTVLTATLQDATTRDIAFTPSASAYGQVFLGQAAIGVGGAAAGQKGVLIKTAVTQFKASEWVLLSKADRSVQEVAQIDTINTLTLTMKTNLINTWLEDDIVFPLFSSVTYKSGTIDAGKHLDVYAEPDRTIAL